MVGVWSLGRKSLVQLEYCSHTHHQQEVMLSGIEHTRHGWQLQLARHSPLQETVVSALLSDILARRGTRRGEDDQGSSHLRSCISSHLFCAEAKSITRKLVRI